MNCNRAITLTLVNNIGIHQAQDLADFKIRIRGVDINEMMNSNKNWIILFSTQINNGDIIIVMRNVLIL